MKIHIQQTFILFLPSYCIDVRDSDYTGKKGCAENELVSYTAYSTGTCFGYGNYSSTYFSANITAGDLFH